MIESSSGTAGRARGAMVLGLSLALLVPACGPARSPEADARSEVHFTELDEGVWLHSSYKDVPPWGLVVSHGLIVVRHGAAILVDTAWSDAQTERLLSWAAQRGTPIVAAVSTHAHDDKMGGVGLLRARGIATFAHPLSNEFAPLRGLSPAEYALDFDAEGFARPSALPGLTVFYPGAGHTVDNIVVGVDGSPFLFGGCLIRPGESSSLGNTEDADLSAWAESTRAVARAFPEATVIIPSHGPPGERSLLAHTIALAEPR